MVTTRKTTAASSVKPATANGKAKAKPENGTSKAVANKVTSEALAERIRTAIERKYKVKLAEREERIAIKVGYAVQEKLGLDIQSQVNKNGNKTKFDWRVWNEQIFPKILGEPNNLKYPIETIAEAMTILYDSISTENPINDLVEFNLQSLQRRNGNGNSKQEDEDDFELDDLDEEIEDVLDDTSDSEEDEEEDEDEEFELDED